MKTQNKNLTVLYYVCCFGLLVIGGAATVVNSTFFSLIIPGISQKLYIIPGIIAWIAAVNLLVIGFVAETRKNHQVLSPIILRQETTFRQIRDSKHYEEQKFHTYLPDETGGRCHIYENTFVSKSKNQ